MDAAERWLRANDPEYRKDKAIKKRKDNRNRTYNKKAVKQGERQQYDPPKRARVATVRGRKMA